MTSINQDERSGEEGELCVREALKGEKKNENEPLSSLETKANFFFSIFVEWGGIKRSLHSLLQNLV